MPAGDPVSTIPVTGIASASPFFRVQVSGDHVIARPLRINEQIRIRQIRVIDNDGAQLGILATEDALARARTQGLDLIEVSPTAVPPVCRIGDYGRLKYEQSKKDKDARKKQRNFELREVKLRPKIGVHDYEVKAKMAERLLLDGGKVKVTIMFRGREITYTAFGKRLLDRISADLENTAAVEREARLEGKNMFLILAPRMTPLGPPRFVHEKDKPVPHSEAPHIDPDDHENDHDDDHDHDHDHDEEHDHEETAVAHQNGDAAEHEPNHDHEEAADGAAATTGRASA